MLTLAQILCAFIGTGITYATRPADPTSHRQHLMLPPANFQQHYESILLRRTTDGSNAEHDSGFGRRLQPWSANLCRRQHKLPYRPPRPLLCPDRGFRLESGDQNNPALDFGGPVTLSAIGYPKTVWTMGAGYARIQTVAPVMGACFGAWMYDV